jgi:transposase
MQSERGSYCLQLRVAVRARSPNRLEFSRASSATGDGALPITALVGLRIDRERARSRSTGTSPTSAFWRFWISRRHKAMPGGRAHWWRRRWETLTFNMFGASCASTRLIWRPVNPGARATTLSSRRKPPTWCDPPAKAIVLCVDEKPSIQALERAQGYLKLPNGRALTGQSHDYKRHGTTTLFAALEVATGRIIAAHSKRRRRVEFLGFMNHVVATFPDRELHVVLDNLNTRKKCERWLKKHPNVHFHFTPTRASWLNQVETWFSILQGQSLSGASFTPVEQLQEHIDAFIAAYNETAVPFAWTKKRVHQRRFKNRRITQL